jgi:hypothetical protein
VTIYNPANQQFGRVEPYISLTEFKFSATASAIDFTNLVAVGGQAAQDQALYELIVRASAKADRYTMGLLGTLNATLNTESGRYMVNREGNFIVHPSFGPILGVSAFSYANQAGAFNQVTLSSQNCWPERWQFIITNQGYGGSSQVFTGIGALSAVLNGQATGTQYCTYSYLSGYPNTFTTSTSAAGATSLNIVDPTAMIPGNYVTLWDGTNDEYVQISETYNGSTTLTLTNPLQFAHGSGVNVSAIPADVKQAVIHFVVAMVKQRGQGGLVLNELGEGVPVSGRVENSSADEVIAYDLLADHRVPWGRN